MACDACVSEIIEDEDGEPLNAGRRTRTISAPLRRLLNARDKGCRFPGCANARYIDAHHIHHWANGGETKPGNLVSLCRFHHRAVHEGGFGIQRLDDGALRFVRPDGEAVVADGRGPINQPSGDWREIPQGATPFVYRGDRMDLGMAVDVMMQARRRGLGVPAGTFSST
jgi:hypothetical protein